MKFELTAELIGLIIFGMENQEAINLFDSEKLVLVPEEEVLALVRSDDQVGERFLPLPEWRSVDGFNLMEGFVTNLRNPVFREELRQILKSGRGVFRQFKNALKDRPDIERLWFRYRQKEMHQRVLDWYNDYREIWGLTPYAVVERDGSRDDLVFSDFGFRLANATESVALVDWDRQLFVEMYPDCDENEREYLYRQARRGLPVPAANTESRVVLAATPDGEMAGFVWGVETVVGTQCYGRVVQLGVQPDFRGLGLGSALLGWYYREARERGLCKIYVEVPASGEFLADKLQASGFAGQATVWAAALRPAD